MTTSDEVNMVACSLAKALGARRTVARVRNPEYSGYLVTSARSAVAPRRVVTPETLGISLFVNPDLITAQEIVDILSSLHTAPLVEFADGRVQAREFRVDNGEIAGKSISKLKFPKPCTIAAIVRSNNVLLPKGDEVLKDEDRVWVIAAREDIDEIGAVFGRPVPKARNIVILGGQHTGFRVAQMAEKRGIRVKVIEPDAVLCLQLSEQLERAEVVQGTGTDQNVLIEEGVPSADAFMATTSNDELNILVSIVAKSLGAKRSLTLVEKPEYISLAESVGVDVAVSPLLLAASKITRLVRSPAVVSVSFLVGMQMEAVEYSVNQSARIGNKRPAEAGIPDGVKVGAIVRSNKVIIPQKDTIIQPGDRVILVGLAPDIRIAEKLFE
jgi:trk system potassium uptake protein TrkA